MSAIATVLAAMGHHVSGSDSAGGPVLDRLEALGVEVHTGHDPAWVGVADVVAASTAVPPGDPELVEALRRGLPVLRRSEILAAVCRQKRTIGVSGTHGKTTTASMLAVVLLEAGVMPSMIIGGDISGIGSGALWDPRGDWLVVEADESDGTFLELGCEMVVVTSVSSDHLDHYGTRDAIDEAFLRFVSDAPAPAVVCADDPGAAALLARLRGTSQTLSYGQSPQAALRVHEVSLERFAARFSLTERGRDRGRFELAVPGLHNVLNATAALAAATAAGASWERAREGIAAYRGVGRRFELRGEAGGVAFIDDYAHNPEKVAAALAAARGGNWSRIVAVFQPHRYTRTKALWREFGPALAGADVVIVTDVYAAGEQPLPGVTGRLVAGAVRDASPRTEVFYEPTLDGAARVLAGLLRAGDVCLSIGAGDVTTLAGKLLHPGTTETPGG
jgi:UDP-N-acetylmuramate--alanine ligase